MLNSGVEILLLVPNVNFGNRNIVLGAKILLWEFQINILAPKCKFRGSNSFDTKILISVVEF